MESVYIELGNRHEQDRSEVKSYLAMFEIVLGEDLTLGYDNGALENMR